MALPTNDDIKDANTKLVGFLMYAWNCNRQRGEKPRNSKQLSPLKFSSHASYEYAVQTVEFILLLTFSPI